MPCLLRTHFLTFLLICTALASTYSATITGKFHPADQKVVYLYELDYFAPATRSLLIDSLTLTADQNFSKELKLDHPKLVYLTTLRQTPPTAGFLQYSPQYYYFSFCAKFYSSGIYLYLDPTTSVHLDWITHDFPRDSVVYSGPDGEEQAFIREFYEYVSRHDYDAPLRSEHSYRTMPPAEAYELVTQAKKEARQFVKEHQPGLMSEALTRYLTTEIEYGALNQFLNWYEYGYSDKLREQFRQGSLPPLYTQILGRDRLSDQPGHGSIEYYKFLERYVTHRLNVADGEFRKFHEDLTAKKNIAATCLPATSKDLYLRQYSLTR